MSVERAVISWVGWLLLYVNFMLMLLYFSVIDRYFMDTYILQSRVVTMVK